MSTFLVDIQCQQFGYLIIYRKEVYSIWRKRLYEKVLYFSKRPCYEYTFEKKKMLPLTKEELNLHQDATNCYICTKSILKRFAKSKNYRKVRDHCHYAGTYRGAAHSICNFKFNLPNEVPVVFHNVSDYNCFIVKELANESEGQFECLGENTEKYKKFSVPAGKEITKITIKLPSWL